MIIVSRVEWGARKPRGGVLHVEDSRRTLFMVHHSGGGPGQTPRSIQDWCMDGRGFKDIDYNFLVDQGGKIYEGRGWTAIGSHCRGLNTEAYGVCVIGHNDLSTAAKLALRQLYRAARDRSPHIAVTTHRDHAPTDCPGPLIHAWVHGGGLAARDLQLTVPRMRGGDVQAVQRIVGANPDAEFGPDTDRRVRAWQQAHHLMVDGIVGPLTRAAMGL
jgi:peptidoglycan hydrolase-like protein with peptidoglycan-binding domain